MFSFSNWYIAFVGFLVGYFGLVLINDERVRDILKRDAWGYGAFVVGLLMLAVGFTHSLDFEWTILLLAIGGLVTGVSLLVALPDRFTNALTQRKNLWFLTYLGGLVLIAWSFLGILPKLIQAFSDFFSETKLSEGIALTTGVVLLVVSQIATHSRKKEGGS